MALLGILKNAFGARANAEAAAPLLVNAYATLRTLPPLDFPHALNAKRDLNDPDLAPHLEGFVGYVLSRGDQRMTAARYRLWRHVQRTRNHASFSAAVEDLPAVEAWAERACAILFLPDGTIRAPDMAVLLDHEGASDPDASPPYTPDAVDRRKRMLARLEGVSPRPPASMPPSLGEDEVALRSAPETMKRAMALFYVAAHGEEPGVIPALAHRNPLGLASLTPAERAFVDGQWEAEQASRMTWRYEALNVLLWALSIGDADIDRSDEQMSVVPAWNAVRGYVDEDSLAALRLRPTREILDALDRTWLEHWITRQADLDDGAVPGFSRDIVMERHHALNWLTGFQNPPGAEWDDIDCPT